MASWSWYKQLAGAVVQTVVGTPSCYGKKAPHGILDTVSTRLHDTGSKRYAKVDHDTMDVYSEYFVVHKQQCTPTNIVE